MKHILVVDDKPENLYYLRVLLQSAGYRVTEALNGELALREALDEPPDLVVSDLLMPIMDGYALLRAWKLDAHLKGIPFIVYTATYTEPEDEQLALDLGCDAFLVKPTEPDVFLEMVAQVLARDGVRAPRNENPVNQQTDQAIFQVYSQTLVRKLEEKSEQLEQLNNQLRHDIRQREAAEAALRESEERFRLLVEATTDVAWDWNLENHVCWVSPGWFDLLGYPVPAPEKVGDWWRDLMHPDDRDNVLEQRMSDVQGTGLLRAIKYRLRHANGSWVHVEDRAHAVRNASGKAIRIVGGVFDLTRSVRLEEQLRRAQRLEALGQLTGGVAHDFNNLLTVVLGNSQLISELAADNPGMGNLARMITQAAERGAELTRHLLAFARRQPLDPAAVNLEAQIDTVMPLLHKAIGPGIEIRCQFERNLPAVHVDAAQLDNALLNLCVNARDAMGEHGVITVSAALVQVPEEGPEPAGYVAPGPYVRLSVADTGGGIPAELQSQIFEPFFTTKAEGKGSGLGLAMVFGFVRQTGGHIMVSSRPGQGATFSLYLPCANAAAQAQERAQAAQLTAVPGGGSVLLVEDDHQVREFACTMVASLGYKVKAAESAHQALDILKQESFDLLFTDILMPGINGRQLAREAQALKPRIKVLFTTGFAGHDDHVSKGLGGESAPVLYKPYRREKLAQMLKNLLA